MTPKREGYLLVDHQASPGLPEDVAIAAGYDPLMCREGKRFEAATLTCAHCKSAIVKNPLRVRQREACMKCSGRYICDICAFKASLPDYVHSPYTRYVDVTADLWAKNLQMKSHNELLFGDPVRTAKPLAAPPPPVEPVIEKEQTNG